MKNWMRRAVVATFVAGTAAGSLALNVPSAGAVIPGPRPSVDPALTATSGDSLAKITFTSTFSLLADVSFVEFRASGSQVTDTPLNPVLGEARVILTDSTHGYFRVPALAAGNYEMEMIVSGQTKGVWQTFTVTGTLPSCPDGDTVTSAGSTTDSLLTTFVCEHVVTKSTDWTVPVGVTSVDILAVGGGGGGGGVDGVSGYGPVGGGGGGGGEVTACLNQSASGKTFTVTVGARGNAGFSTFGGGPSRRPHVVSAVRPMDAITDGDNGYDSSVEDGATNVCAALGGSGGKYGGTVPVNGKQGWGGNSGNGKLGGAAQVTTVNTVDLSVAAGGGGGADADGSAASSNLGGKGGDGKRALGTSFGLFDLTQGYFGAGGGGGSGADVGGVGGRGGGGDGGSLVGTAAVASSAGSGFGSGGGGGTAPDGTAGYDAADGADGVVIFRYLLPEPSADPGVYIKSRGAQDCTAYATIAAAIADVLDGETIVVCSGTYQEGALTVPSAITELTIQGEVRPVLVDPTAYPAVGPQTGAPVIDGQTLTRVLDAPDTVLHLVNLNLENGSAAAPGGGAVRAKRLTLDHMNITSSTTAAASDGGAVLAVDASPANTAAAPTIDIDTSSFSGNSATRYGGAVASPGYVVINGSTFDNNDAKSGGALYTNGGGTITGTAFTGNDATVDPSTGYGGAVYTTGVLSVSKSTFDTNGAQTSGGAIYTTAAAGIESQVVNSTFVGNHADTAGGASVIGQADPTKLTFANKTSADGILNKNAGYFGSEFVYALFAVGPKVYVGTPAGLSISSDGGTTWTTTKNKSDGLADDFVTAVYAEGDTIYVGSLGYGLAISTDGGTTWTTKTTNSYSDVIAGLTGAGGKVYASTYDGVLISADGGQNWTKTLSGNVFALFARGSTVYAAQADGSLAISTDGGATWTTKSTTSAGVGTRIGIYENGGRIFLGVNGAGVAISSDGGDTWVTKTTSDGLASNKVGRIFGSGNNLYVGSEDGGLSVSTDGGTTWTTKNTSDGLGSNSVNAPFVSDGAIYAATSSGLSISGTHRVSLVHVTAVNNTSTSGKALVLGGGQLANTLFVNSGSCNATLMTIAEGTLSDDSSCGTVTSGLAAGMDTFALRAGNTIAKTYSLKDDSPAVDGGDCSPTLLGSVRQPSDDQNGTRRPWGDSCDAGAVEAEVGTPPPPPSAEPGVWIERTVANGGPVLPEDCTAYPTISAAVADAFDNDIIHICPGLYVEDNTLNLLGLANITFKGDGNVPDDVQIDGGFPATGPNKHRIVNAAGQTVSFENLVLQNGYLEGAATHEGGAAVIASHVNATNVIFRNNRVVQSATGDNYGGAVSAGTATITDSAFSEHGTEVNGQSGSATLGGALYLSGAGASTITRTSFFHNFTHTDEEINSVTQNTKGGAVYATGPLTVTDSYFIENGATFGGAIAALGALTITNTVFDGNHNFASATASQGGAVWAQGSTTITDSEFLAKSEFSKDSANDPDEGVAVRAFGSLTISGSTFTDDFTTALKATGVVYSSATGGSPDVSITNSTFFGNDLQGSTVVHAAGKVELVYVTAVSNTTSGANVVDATDSLTVTNSLFALNTGAASAVAGCNGGAGSAKTSTVSDSSCGDVVGSFSPSSFGAFTYHGAALTKTLELAAGNAGIAAASCAAAATVTLDQNGTTRGATCDAGAMEYAQPDSDRSCPDDTVTTTVGVDTATGRPVCQLVLTADGNFEVPEGVSSVDVVLVGGGGGGGGGGTDSAEIATMSGGGGGGGSVSLHKGVTVTPLATIPVTVGSGGAHGAGGIPAEVWRGANGGDGGTTSFLSLTALGGKGGTGGGEEGGTYYVGAGGSTPASSSGVSKNAAHSGASGATLRTWDINRYYTASGAGAGAGGAGSVGVLGPRFGLYSSTFGGAGGVGFTPADPTSLFGSNRWPWSLGDTNYNRFAAYVGLAMGGSGAVTGVGNYDTYTFYCGRGASLHGWDWGWTGVGSSSGIIVLDGVITGTDADMEQPAGDGPCGASTGYAYGSGGGGGAGFQSWQADGSDGRDGAVIIRYVVPGVPGETGNGRVWIERDLGSGGVPVDKDGVLDLTVSCDNPTYRSITAAVDAAVANDIVHVCSGTYREDEIVVEVNNLTIQGTDWVAPAGPIPGSTRPQSARVGVTLPNDVIIDGESTDGDTSTRHRIFDATGLTITFNNVVLQHGSDPDVGGAVRAHQAVFVDSTVQDNTAPGGGAVFVSDEGTCDAPISRLVTESILLCAPVGSGLPLSSASVTVTASEFLRNGANQEPEAPVRKGSVYLDGSVDGGAVYAAGGTVTVTDSVFEDNEANVVSGTPLATDGAGGAILADVVEVYGSSFTGNSAWYHGGAIAASSVTVRASTTQGTPVGTLFESNTVTGDATWDGYGGAIWSAGVDVANASFVTNTADSGGAIASAVPQDSAPVSSGDPVSPATVIIEASTFDSNSATDDGGAVLNKAVSGSTTVYNSTFSANHADDAGGAVYAQDALSVSFSTFDANTADVAGGVFWTPVAPSVDDNIFSFAAADETEAAKNGCLTYEWTPAKDVKNLTTNYWCPGTVVDFADLVLSPLADNGGPTKTMAIGIGSAALDTADQTECDSRTDPTDQRGNHRAVGKACDIGAYEYFGQVTLDGPAGQDNTFTSPDGVKTLHILLIGGGGGGGAFGPNGEAGGGGGGGEVVECTIDLASSATEVHYYFGLGGAEGENGEDSKIWISDEASPECLAHGGNAGAAGGSGGGAGTGGDEGVTSPAVPNGGGVAVFCLILGNNCSAIQGASIAGGGGGGAGGAGGAGLFDSVTGLSSGGAGGVGKAPSDVAFGDTSTLYGGGGGGGAYCTSASSGGDGGSGGGGSGASGECVTAPVSGNPPTLGGGTIGGGGGGGAGTIPGGAGGSGTGEVRTPAPLGPGDIIHVCMDKLYVIYGAKYFKTDVDYCIPIPDCSTPGAPTTNGPVSGSDPNHCCPAPVSPVTGGSLSSKYCCPAPVSPVTGQPVSGSDPNHCCPAGPVSSGDDPNHCVQAPDTQELSPTDGYQTLVGSRVVASGTVSTLDDSLASDESPSLETPVPLHYEHGVPDGYKEVEPEDYPEYTPPTCTTDYVQGMGVADSPRDIVCTGGDPGDKLFDYSFLDGGLRIHPAELKVKPKHLRVAYGTPEPNPYEYTIKGFKLGETIADLGSDLPVCDSDYTDTAPAGSKFDITCSGGDAANYTFKYEKSHIHVDKRRVPLRPVDRTVTYGDPVPQFGFTLSGLRGPESALAPERLAGFVAPVCSSTYTPTTSAGSADINCLGAASTNYEFVPVKGTITVRKASLRVLPKSMSVAYGASSPQVGFDLAGFVNGETVPGSGYAAPKCSAVGYTATTAAGSSLSVTCTGGVSRNYELDQTATSSLLVTKATATVTADAKSVVYGSAAPAYTYTVSGLRNGETAASAGVSAPSCSSAYTTETPVGTVSVNCTGASAANYDFTYVPATVTVTKATLKVSPNAVSTAYGQAVPAITWSVDGFVNGQSSLSAAGYTAPTCSTSATAASNAGTYAITCSGGAAANYQFVYGSAAVTVSKAVLKAMPAAASVVYGSAAPTVGVTVTGFINGQTTSTAAGYKAPACTPATYTTASNVGTYGITCSGGSATNYSFDNSAVSLLTVTKATATLTADSKSVVYGTAAPAWTYTLSGLKNGQTAATVAGLVAPTCVSTYTATTAAGSVPAITCSGASSTNYSFTYVGGKATVTKATLTVAPNSLTIVKGSAVPSYAYAVSGWQNGQGPTTATSYIKPVCKSSYTTRSAIGNYTIACSSGSAANYQFVYKTATLTVR